MFEIKKNCDIQQQYLELLNQYKNEFINRNLTDFRLKMLFEAVQIFWYKNREFVSFTLNNINDDDGISFLAGAVYTDTKNSGHIDFSLLGNKRIINDPILKVSNFFQVDSIPINYQRIKDYVYDVGTDIIVILEKYSDDFFILPLGDINQQSKIKRLAEIASIADELLLSALDNKFDSIKAFCTECTTYEEIEQLLNPQALSSFVYLSIDDKKLSLRERIEKYCLDMLDYSLIKKQQTEPEIFVLVTIQYIMQCLDIFFTSNEYNIIPYIRNDVVFCYMISMLDLILSLVSIQTLNYCVIAYIAQKRYDFSKYDYPQFIQTVGNNRLVKIVFEEMSKSGCIFPEINLIDIAKILDEKYKT